MLSCLKARNKQKTYKNKTITINEILIQGIKFPDAQALLFLITVVRLKSILEMRFFTAFHFVTNDRFMFKDPETSSG